MSDALHDAVEDRAAIAAHNLADAVHDHMRGIAYTPMSTISDTADEVREVLSGVGESRYPVTMIEEKIDHAAWVFRELVSRTGFQAELVVYGGDYEERGPGIERDCRISLRRDIFEMEHIKALVEFAADHGCHLEMNKYGASLRVNQGRSLSIEQNEAVSVNATTTGAAAGKASITANSEGLTFTP